ncbi:hypothetical protein CKO15_04520 [Halorhodospira abdelmalekii]|uniref:hypothetical protein n=1 Tax=Halorhodospira abdelmalekii TaxID=421629 RepID=UPI001902FBAB|nr:hypothetical protein [Halorhodospira abdelmalekii]MBK1734560.1 hypothetical protein [Halorhodospira abdelmalekii]
MAQQEKEEKTRMADERIALIVAGFAALLTALGATVLNSLPVVAVFGGLTVLSLFFFIVAYSVR